MANTLKELPKGVELIPDFLTESEAAEVFAAVDAEFKAASEFVGIGSELKQNLHYGRKTEELKPKGKVMVIRPWDAAPVVLVGLKDRLQEKYDCTFNAVQVNRHEDETKDGFKHFDGPKGVIAMVSVGADGKFWVAGKTVDIPNGSLLKFVGKVQHGHLPSEGLRYSIIYRNITANVELPRHVTPKEK
jgi:hypothetical protein